jgi:hypothetical protein
VHSPSAISISCPGNGHTFTYNYSSNCSTTTQFCSGVNENTCTPLTYSGCTLDGASNCSLTTTYVNGHANLWYSSTQTSPTVTQPPNALYSLRLFSGDTGATTRVPFRDVAGATTFDGVRLQLSSLKTSTTDPNGTVAYIDSTATAVPTTLSADDGDGFWMPYSGQYTNSSGNSVSRPVAERTATVSSVFNGCAFTNSMLAVAPAGSSSALCSSTAVYSQANFYHLHAVTGGLCPGATSFPGCTSSSGFSACVRQQVTAATPPPVPQIAVFINHSTGQYSAAVVTAAPGRAPSSMAIGGAGNPVQWIYSLEVPRNVHYCRHVTSGNVCQ